MDLQIGFSNIQYRFPCIKPLFEKDAQVLRDTQLCKDALKSLRHGQVGSGALGNFGCYGAPRESWRINDDRILQRRGFESDGLAFERYDLGSVPIQLVPIYSTIRITACRFPSLEVETLLLIFNVQPAIIEPSEVLVAVVGQRRQMRLSKVNEWWVTRSLFRGFR